MTKQDVRYAYFLYIVYFVFAIYNVRIVVVQPHTVVLGIELGVFIHGEQAFYQLRYVSGPCLFTFQERCLSESAQIGHWSGS